MGFTARWRAKRSEARMQINLQRARDCAGIAAVVLGLFAAGLWWWAASVPIREGIGEFMADLQRISEANQWAATVTGAAALVAAVAELLRVLVDRRSR